MAATPFQLICITLLTVLLPFTQTAQILGLFPHPGKSHFEVFRPLLIGLAESGHNVSVISFFPNKVPVPNYTDIQLSGMDLFVDFVDLQFFSDKEFDLIPYKVPIFFMLHHWGLKVCEFALNSDIIKNLVTTLPKYDVIILEQFNNDCMMAVAHLLNAPVIALSSCAMMSWHYKRMGTPFNPSFMPMNLLTYNDEMNFIARANNFLHFHTVNLLYEFLTQRQTNALVQQYLGPNIPPVQDLIKNTSLMLINQHWTLNSPYPYTPNVIEIGGLHIQAEEVLEPNLQQLLDRSKKGVVYISWGSMIRSDTLPVKKQEALLNAISQLPDYLFLMKWPVNATLPNKPRNLVTRAWLPQRTLLCHANVRAFMAHGGLLGVSEAAYCGVPMLVTPFYGDQFLNAASVEKRKLGVVLKYKDFNEPNILRGLSNILDPSFTHSVKLFSESYRTRPLSARNLSVWWVEYVINNKGGPALAKSTAIEMNWLIYNSFDVYLFLLGILMILITFVIFIVKVGLFIARKLRGERKLKSKLH